MFVASLHGIKIHFKKKYWINYFNQFGKNINWIYDPWKSIQSGHKMSCYLKIIRSYMLPQDHWNVRTSKHDLLSPVTGLIPTLTSKLLGCHIKGWSLGINHFSAFQHDLCVFGHHHLAGWSPGWFVYLKRKLSRRQWINFIFMCRTHRSLWNANDTLLPVVVWWCAWWWKEQDVEVFDVPHDKKLAVQQARTLDKDTFEGAENLWQPICHHHHHYQSATTTTTTSLPPVCHYHSQLSPPVT